MTAEFGKHPLLVLLCAALAGASLPLAFAPYGIFPLAVASPAALFLLWRNATPGVAAMRGWCFGLGMFGHGVWWVQVSIHRFGLPLYSFSVTMTVLFVAFMALYPAVIGWACRRLPAPSENWRLCALMVPLWVLGEWVRGWLFSGFPWLHLGYSQVGTWLGHWAPLGGVHASSLAVCAMAALGVLGLCSRGRRRTLALSLMLLVPLAALALASPAWTHGVGAIRKVALIQGAVPQAVKWRAEYREQTIALYENLSAPHWTRDVIIWPETALPAFPEEIADALARLDARARAHRAALLVGMPSGSPREGAYFNSVALLDGSGLHYDKHHLVPFGEYLPFDAWLRPVLDFLTIPMSSFAPGPERQPALAHGALRFGISICYEDAYASEVRKALPEANVLVNVSDDAWFGDTIAPHQHLQITQMRALETGRYLLRATNTGISAIIDPKGRIRARSPQFEPFVLEGEMRAYVGLTPFARWGHLPVMGGCAILLALAVGLGLGRKRAALTSR